VGGYWEDTARKPAKTVSSKPDLLKLALMGHCPGPTPTGGPAWTGKASRFHTWTTQDSFPYLNLAEKAGLVRELLDPAWSLSRQAGIVHKPL